MPDIGEPISPTMVDVDETTCPFDHDLENPPTVKNDLIGVGTTLGNRMKAPKGTHLYDKIKADYEPSESIINPKDDLSHVLAKGKKPVKIECYTGDRSDVSSIKITHTYPVRCAAHHCIPAQESLKDHPILAFMCKKGSSDESNHGYGDGQVWSNVGYDVNGIQNGVYLPGSYAVGGGRGGMKVWTQDDADKDHEDVSEPADPNSNLLTGELNEISNVNRKWLYVKQATRLAKGQFHDRHVDYSTKFVKGILDKIDEDYINRYERSFLVMKCSKCKDRYEKAEKLGIPTPYGLVERLNRVSAKCAAYLTGHTWPLNVYTSMWGRAFMEAKQKGIKDAD